MNYQNTTPEDPDFNPEPFPREGDWCWFLHYWPLDLTQAALTKANVVADHFRLFVPRHLCGEIVMVVAKWASLDDATLTAMIWKVRIWGRVQNAEGRG